MLGELITSAELCERWGCSPNSLHRRWRDGVVPPPINADQGHSWRWRVEVIDAFELGEWKGAA